MLIIGEEDSLRPLVGNEVRKCAKCAKKATWQGTDRDGRKDQPMCAWCVLYVGSEWGYENRDEILAMGIQIRQRAVTSRNSKVHVPELDERHRLDPVDSEKLMLGVAYCSQHLRSKLVGVLGALRGQE